MNHIQKELGKVIRDLEEYCSGREQFNTTISRILWQLRTDDTLIPYHDDSTSELKLLLDLVVPSVYERLATTFEKKQSTIRVSKRFATWLANQSRIVQAQAIVGHIRKREVRNCVRRERKAVIGGINVKIVTEELTDCRRDSRSAERVALSNMRIADLITAIECRHSRNFNAENRRSATEALYLAYLVRNGNMFQSTPPVGGDTRMLPGSDGSQCVSIHAPRRGRYGPGQTGGEQNDSFNPRPP